MARRPQDVTDAEREVLCVLWDRRPATFPGVATLFPSAAPMA